MLKEIFLLIIHSIRLWFEPSSCIEEKKWRVKRHDRYSIPMAYDVACDYARMINGTIERVKK
jgi:hypothetical protein